MSKPTCTSRRHRWVRRKDVGCDQNPGVYSLGGAHIAVAEECSHCEARRTEHTNLVTKKSKTVYV